MSRKFEFNDENCFIVSYAEPYGDLSHVEHSPDTENTFLIWDTILMDELRAKGFIVVSADEPEEDIICEYAHLEASTVDEEWYGTA